MKEGEYYEFGPFKLICFERRLLRDGRPVVMTNKAFDTLLALVGKSGHLVRKSELFDVVWKGSCVEEGNLAVTISMIRKALGDSPRDQKYIQTITKRGYRFVASTRHLKIDELPVSAQFMMLHPNNS
jgi:DNA-binding winged helix-turn-helix (wHTH) protein